MNKLNYDLLIKDISKKRYELGNISLNKAAKEIGFSRTILTRLYNKRGRFTIDSIGKITNWLGTTIDRYLEKKFPIHFEAGIRGSKKHFRVQIHETRSEMHEAYLRFNQESGKDVDPSSIHHLLAAVLPYRRFNYPDSNTEILANDIGVIMFNYEDINETAISHEVVHAGMHFFRTENKGIANFAEDCNDKEEDLAYAVSDLFHEITNKFKQLNK